MSNNYIELSLTNKGSAQRNHSGHSFNCFIEGKDKYISNYMSAIGKIDTGCSFSMIPYYWFDTNDIYRHEGYSSQKLKDIERYRDGLVKIIGSRGVESQHIGAEVKNSKYWANLSDIEILNDSSASFIHTIESFHIDNYFIGDVKVKINYNRDCFPLIGMNILKMLDFHCGRSEETGEYIFLGCLKDRINEDYLNAYRRHFKHLIGKKTAKNDNDSHKSIAAAFRDFYNKIL